MNHWLRERVLRMLMLLLLRSGLGFILGGAVSTAAGVAIVYSQTAGWPTELTWSLILTMAGMVALMTGGLVAAGTLNLVLLGGLLDTVDSVAAGIRGIMPRWDELRSPVREPRQPTECGPGWPARLPEQAPGRQAPARSDTQRERKSA